MKFIDSIYDRLETWRSFEDTQSIFPRPLTEWYMFDQREYWEEYAAFESRLRCATKRVRKNTGEDHLIPQYL